MMINKVKKIRGKVVNLMSVPVENHKKMEKNIIWFYNRKLENKVCKIIYT